jgi:hypothetical protein
MSVSFAQETNGANQNSDPKFMELLRKVEMYLDRDFEETSEQHLLLEIQNDPTSIKLLKAEHSFRTFFKTSFKRDAPPPSLQHSILEKIRHTSA